MPNHCFTYGSLMWADIMARVCGHELACEPARLHGHRRHPVQGEDYPGLCPVDGGVVDGRLYRGLDPVMWTRLDAFEGADYERVQVPVALADGRTETAWVYRFRAEQAARLLPGDWDVQAFEREGRERFLARYVGFSQPPVR
ncbi:gamma-glutamylcyclotransferase family protein [Roseateles sp.]|uniref:gamma-glutamylcyclotransferase family protein n=1 Tax=Roseateles sp. TaxID=1971397 RepID=UPI003263C32C